MSGSSGLCFLGGPCLQEVSVIHKNISVVPRSHGCHVLFCRVLRIPALSFQNVLGNWILVVVMLWESFWNKHWWAGGEMSPADRSQDGSWKASMLGPVCILILCSKTPRWARKASTVLQRRMWPVSRLLRATTFVSAICLITLFQVPSEVMLDNRQYNSALSESLNK